MILARFRPGTRAHGDAALNVAPEVDSAEDYSGAERTRTACSASTGSGAYEHYNLRLASGFPIRRESPFSTWSGDDCLICGHLPRDRLQALDTAFDVGP